MKFPALLIIAFSYLVPGTVQAQTSDVPNDVSSLITEDFFAPREDRSLYDNRRNLRDAEKLWHVILRGMSINNVLPEVDGYRRYRRTNCHFETALSTLDTIRLHDPDNKAYQKLWAANQNRVFSACSQAKVPVVTPIKPEGDNLPLRANSDFNYQLASWFFYSGKYEQALAHYQKVDQNIDAPIRPLAAYMSVRTLAYTGSEDLAYAKIQEILDDPSLKSVHEIAANYRFVMMYYGGHSDALTQTHFEWLLSVVRKNPVIEDDLSQGIGNYFDAMDHLDRYFPLFDLDSGRVDWWLGEKTPVNSRMKAVKLLSKSDELVDWKQAYWAYNAFDQDWLWALHSKEADYWGQNKTIVDHAWTRWLAGDGLEWLEIAISRVHPDDPLSIEVLKASAGYIDQDWRSETYEYRRWLNNIWTHSLRLNLGHKTFPVTLDLIRDHLDFTDLMPEPKYRSYRDANYKTQIEMILRWLVYTGEKEQAREILSTALELYPDDYYRPSRFQNWRILLADNWAEVLSIGKASYRHSRSSYANPIWENILNALPSEELYSIMEDGEMNPDMRKAISLSILTRSIVLEDNETIDKYALFAAENNLTIRAQILDAVSGHDRDSYIDLLLRTPRMRPVPFYYGYNFFGYEKSLNKIDTYNHNDNNWWCSTSRQDLQDRISRAARVTLRGDLSPSSHRWRHKKNEELQKEQEFFFAKQQEILNQHPFQKRLDQDEGQALEDVVSAPEYLSSYVNNREYWNSFKFWRSTTAQDKSAANLHYAVRTTRYGCERDGSHGPYSQEAFRILHDSYSNSLWAKATPYWFN